MPVSLKAAQEKLEALERARRERLHSLSTPEGQSLLRRTYLLGLARLFGKGARRP